MAVKMILQNFLKAPLLMKFILALGLVAPFLAIFSLINIKPTMGFLLENEVKVVSYFEYIGATVCMLPICIASMKILLKLQMYRYLYGAGWVVGSFSSIMLMSPPFEIDVFIIESAFDMGVGIVVMLYLFLSKDVKFYFEGGKVGDP